MAKKRKKGGKGAPRPSYKMVNKELERLAKDLAKIEKDGRDEFGDLTELQMGQVQAARISLAGARAALGCIQDQAPYNMSKK